MDLYNFIEEFEKAEKLNDVKDQELTEMEQKFLFLTMKMFKKDKLFRSTICLFINLFTIAAPSEKSLSIFISLFDSFSQTVMKILVKESAKDGGRIFG